MIIQLEDAYPGYQIGQHGKVKAMFGESGSSLANPTSVCIEFETPGNREEEVGFYAGDQFAMGGDRVVVISSEPFAKMDDEGIVGYMEYLNGKPAPRLSCFVNDTAEDPKPPLVRDSTQPGAYPVPRTTWLKPNRTYFAHLYRLEVRSDGMHNPLVLEINGSDTGDQEEFVGIPVTIDGIDYILLPA